MTNVCVGFAWKLRKRFAIYPTMDSKSSPERTKKSVYAGNRALGSSANAVQHIAQYKSAIIS
jgi:hypothetical protein